MLPLMREGLGWEDVGLGVAYCIDDVDLARSSKCLNPWRKIPRKIGVLN